MIECTSDSSKSCCRFQGSEQAAASSSISAAVQLHASDGEQQHQQQLVGLSRQGVAASRSSIRWRNTAKDSKGAAVEPPTASISGMSLQQSPRSIAVGTYSESAQQPPRSPAFRGLHASGTGIMLPHPSQRLPATRATLASTLQSS